jgi:hypothetical protein
MLSNPHQKKLYFNIKPRPSFFSYLPAILSINSSSPLIFSETIYSHIYTTGLEPLIKMQISIIIPSSSQNPSPSPKTHQLSTAQLALSALCVAMMQLQPITTAIRSGIAQIVLSSFLSSNLPSLDPFDLSVSSAITPCTYFNF